VLPKSGSVRFARHTLVIPFQRLITYFETGLRFTFWRCLATKFISTLHNGTLHKKYIFVRTGIGYGALAALVSVDPLPVLCPALKYPPITISDPEEHSVHSAPQRLRNAMMHSYLHKGQDPWKVIKAKFAAWV